MAVAVAVAVTGGGAVAVALAVAGLTKRFFNHIQKDFLINVWGYTVEEEDEKNGTAVHLTYYLNFKDGFRKNLPGIRFRLIPPTFFFLRIFFFGLAIDLFCLDSAINSSVSPPLSSLSAKRSSSSDIIS